MLFNSYEFIFAFLPITWFMFFFCVRFGSEIAISWLVIASLFFYGWWNPVYLILIVSSMILNYGIGRLLSSSFKNNNLIAGKYWLVLGVTLNLSCLAYYKYSVFLIENINIIIGSSFAADSIILPLALSFFTFQQIAYLVDAYKGITHEYKFSHYALFVTFFPQLIAGPIVHHGEMLSQFMKKITFKPNIEHISVGLSIFFIGLFKKAVLADGIAVYATPVFSGASEGYSLSFFEAWGGALAYTFQLYFDFSGYCDMAIGAARLFGICLPLNFNSPYKATNIIDFWRRWHITLSRFLRDYLYIPLGGNRNGQISRYKNLLLTMILGGLWHGAGWTFVIWGSLHGLYLIINHAWNKFSLVIPNKTQFDYPKLKVSVSWFFTFSAVVVGWVFFRSNNIDTAFRILNGMFGLNGFSIPNGLAMRIGGLWDILESIGMETYLGGGKEFVFTWMWLCLLFPIAIAFPNTQQIMFHYEPVLNVKEIVKEYKGKMFNCWQPNISWGLVIAMFAALGILAMTSVSEFLYFQF